MNRERDLDKKELDLCLQEVAKGDNSAFEKLYKDTVKGIFAFIYGFCENYHTAEDLTQTVYLKVKANISKYNAGTDARAWLFQIAKYTALNEIKKIKREVVASDEQTGRFEAKSYEMQDSPVFDAINSVLDAKERQIVIMHVLWGFKHREIADMLSLALGTVLWKYNVAIKKLQTKLREG